MEKFLIVSPHGKFKIKELSDDSLVSDMLLINKIPLNAVSLYIDRGNELECVAGLYKTIGELKAFSGNNQILIVTDRNINYQRVLAKSIDSSTYSISYAVDYTFDNHTNNSNMKHIILDEVGCFNFVEYEVKEFLRLYCKEQGNKKIVVGISGGGDSNTILKALINAGFDKSNIYPVMILGIPDWDKGLERAHFICKEVGLKLKVISAKDIDNLLGRVKKDGSFASDFLLNYPEADTEVIGTLAVHLGLTEYAKELDTNIAVLGMNLEDILAESYLSIMQGEQIRKFPIREIDGMQFWYPLYRCPKKILDGCYHKLSLENYEDRLESNLYWRGIGYYLAQMASSNIAGIEFKLIDGLQKLSNKSIYEEYYYEELGFSILNKIDKNYLEKWVAFKNTI